MSRGRAICCASVGVSVLAACLGCGSDEDPGAAFIARYCDLYKPCCAAAGLPGDGQACRALFAGAASPQAAYNATAGESCLSGLSAISSQPGFCEGDLVPPFTCAQAFGGAVGICIQDNDCPVPPAGEAVRCVSGFANGTEVRKCQVQSRGQAGSTPCVGSVRGGVALYTGTSGDIPDLGYLCHADDGLRCDGTTCVALKATGEPCELSGPFGECADADFCDVTTGLCAARKPIGAGCIDQALECAEGAYCDAAALACAGRFDLGAACTENGQCLSGNCPDGTCTATPSIGAPAVCGG